MALAVNAQPATAAVTPLAADCQHEFRLASLQHDTYIYTSDDDKRELGIVYETREVQCVHCHGYGVRSGVVREFGSQRCE